MQDRISIPFEEQNGYGHEVSQKRRDSSQSPFCVEIAEGELSAGGSAIQTELFRYVLVGGLAFALDAGLLVLLTAVGRVHYLVSASFSFTAGLVLNYVLSRYWVFTRRKLSNTTVEFAVFALIGVVGLALNHLLMWTFTEHAGFHYLISKCCAAAFVLMWSFGARKWTLFRAGR